MTDIVRSQASSWTIGRLFIPMLFQKSMMADTFKKLDGTQKTNIGDDNFAIVTGGGRGFGLFVARSLSEDFHYRVLSASRQRNEWEGEFEQLDLSNFQSIDRFVETLSSKSAIPCSLLVLNSAVANKDSFRTNVLGNARLVHRMIKKNLLSPHARVVLVTGDIYVIESDCDPNFQGSDTRLYAQSKVGLMWYGFQLHKRFPDLEVCLVHPAVSPTGLFPASGLAKFIFEKVTISNEDGAKTIIYCSTARKDKFINGGYFINIKGWVDLPKNDIALDEKKQVKFWEQTLTFAFSE